MEQKGSFLLRRNLILHEGLFAAAASCFADTVWHGLLLSAVLCAVTGVSVLLTAALPRRVPMLLRTVLYSVTASLVYIPSVLAAEQIFSVREVRAAGIALPVLITGLLLSESCPELLRPERYLAMLPKLLQLLIGAVFAILLTATLRELLGCGTVSGMTVLNTAPLPILQQPSAGLILLVMLGAALLPGAEREEHTVNDAG